MRACAHVCVCAHVHVVCVGAQCAERKGRQRSSTMMNVLVAKRHILE